MFLKVRLILKRLLPALTTIRVKIALDWERADKIDERIKQSKQEFLLRHQQYNFLKYK